ncbi:hypothetical protein H310_07356 [Aphanomyces invadans]|uniref:Uncharacterized protein n=1 Tax=Aphanomyces invadans TaxID=157072 RepID=A0A024U3N0_9STRA|nr:hypothetical protein H310_07356 [Aphanomyces invadans]ETW00830.1 hypothetical protein H310_07356 [Aphanomyces invadans]|eukprot:XP_008870965.1 hypothetical protein H310_07356 [Aphanomyces invadans]
MSTLNHQKIVNVTASVDSVHGLVLRNTGGYIYEDRANSKPSVVFRTSNMALLNALTLKLMAGNLGAVVELAFAPNMTVEGQYLLDIFVPTNSLQYLQTDQGGDTIVAPRVLSANASRPISISSFGMGSVVVEESVVLASRLVVESRGSSRVQLNVARSVSAESVDLSTTSLGSIALLANSTTTKHLSAVSAGSGSVYMGSPATKTTTKTTPVSLNATSLTAKTYGDGNVVFLDAGTCQGSDIQTSGHGSVYMHLVRCQNSNVVILGTGNTYLTTTGLLRVQDSELGTVFATGGATVTGSVMVMPPSVPVPPYVPMVEPARSPRTIRLVAKTTTARPATTLPAKSTGADASLWFGLVLGLSAVILIACIVRKVRAKRGVQMQLKAFTEASTPVATNQVVLHF